MVEHKYYAKNTGQLLTVMIKGGYEREVLTAIAINKVSQHMLTLISIAANEEQLAIALLFMMPHQ